jgi:hypothetical protein
MDGDFECDDLTTLMSIAMDNSQHLETLSEHEKRVLMEDYIQEIIRVQTEKELRDLNEFLESTKIADPLDEENNTEKSS